MEEKIKEPETRWDALKEIINTTECREAIAHAWPLYFYAIFQGDQTNRLVTSYPELEEKLKVGGSTIKTWKQRLVEKKVATSTQGNHGWTLKLLTPYDTPLICLKTDYTEIVLRSDDSTKKLMKRMFSSDSMSLLPLIAELAHKVELMEHKRPVDMDYEITNKFSDALKYSNPPCDPIPATILIDHLKDGVLFLHEEESKLSIFRARRMYVTCLASYLERKAIKEVVPDEAFFEQLAKDILETQVLRKECKTPKSYSEGGVKAGPTHLNS